MDKQQAISTLLGYQKFKGTPKQDEALRFAQAQIYKEILTKTFNNLSQIDSSSGEDLQKKRQIEVMASVFAQEIAQKAAIKDPRIERLILQKK